MTMPVTALRGIEDGPGLWLTAAIHGDEIGGTEVIRRVLARLDPRALRGHILAAPIVNVHGFAEGSRYLPDRRDLNRSFPGSARGSLAARLAHLVIENIVAPCSYGIDLHTGSDDRSNLPQIRADLDDPETLALATAFGAAAMIHARLRDGSLREAACRRGSTVLLYEGGEALRFDEATIDVAVEGIMRTLSYLDMIDHIAALDSGGNGTDTPLIARTTSWVRAPVSGLLRSRAELGERVVKGAVLGTVGDALGADERPVRSRSNGMVIGRAENPVVHRGDALFNIAVVEPQAGASSET
jgi:predicted deacylase